MTFTRCFLILACESGVRCGAAHERGRAEEEILDLEKASFLLPVSRGRVTFPGHSRGHDNSLFPMQHESGVLVACGLTPQPLPQNQDVVLARRQPGLSGQHPFAEARDQKVHEMDSIVPLPGQWRLPPRTAACRVLPLRFPEGVSMGCKLVFPCTFQAILQSCCVHIDSFLSHPRENCFAVDGKILLPVFKAEGEAQLFMHWFT